MKSATSSFSGGQLVWVLRVKEYAGDWPPIQKQQDLNHSFNFLLAKMLFNLQKPARSLTKELVNVAKKNRRCMSAAALPNPITSPDIQVLKIDFMSTSNQTRLRSPMNIIPLYENNSEITVFL